MDGPMFVELMRIFSVPRPNGSRSERETIQRTKDWLHERDIPYQIQAFTLYPYYFEILGIWLILSYLVLAVTVFFRTGWIASLVAALALLGGAFSFIAKIHLLTWIGKSRGQNFILQFGAVSRKGFQPEREVIISAHYDSKSEPLDHRQRMFFLKSLQTGILFSILIAGLAPIDRWLLAHNSPFGDVTYASGIALSLIVIILASGYGLNLALARLAPQSCGAVDNGAACAQVLALAYRLAQGASIPRGLLVTLALFGGEEVDRQGSRAYVRSRIWTAPVWILNLEVMSQNGEYVFWALDGSVFRLQPTDPQVNDALSEAVQAVTGRPPRPAGPVLSDGGAFVEAGLPTGVLGTYDQEWIDTGFHGPTDNLDRVVFERLPEGVEILFRFIELCPAGLAQA